MQPCPYCAEEISEAADVCPICGESVSGFERQSAGVSVPGPPCPKCGRQDLRKGSFPWYLGTIGAIVMRVVICNRCGHEFDAKKPHADLPTRKRNMAILLNGIGAAGILAIIGGLVLLIRSTMR